MMRALRSLVTLVLAAWLPGCAALELAGEFAGREPPRLFQTRAPTTFEAELPTLDRSLVIESPSATPGLNTARIALRPTPTTFDYFGGAGWSEVLPVMVQGVLIDAFEHSGGIDVFGPDLVGLRADYALLTEIRDFQAEYEDARSAPRVRVRIQTRLVRLPRRASIASTSVLRVVPAAGTGIEEIVDAFDRALADAARELVAWTLTEASRAG